MDYLIFLVHQPIFISFEIQFMPLQTLDSIEKITVIDNDNDNDKEGDLFL